MAATKKTTSSSLTSSLFKGELNNVLLAQAVRVFLSNQRQGTSKVQTRSEVSRTKKKWFKQKHTGNARHGSRNAHIFVGGGVAHGPNGTQNWTLKLTQKMKVAALHSAFIAQKDNVTVMEELNSFEGKTKQAAQILKDVIADNKRVLVILPSRNEAVIRSLRNIPQVLVAYAPQVNVWEVSVADTIVMTPEAVQVVEKRVESK